MKPRIPNLFIVGAPKCGTSAFAEQYLNTHPQIFMSRLKEPHFFNTDHPEYRVIRNWPQYLDLFADASPNHRWIGEASVWYLYSHDAIPAIHAFNPEARIVAFIRNPVDMAYSLHSQLVHSAEENEVVFEKAWALQAERRLGRHLPHTCTAPEHLQYRAACSLGHQLLRLYKVFPVSQIKLVFFDDLSRDTRKAYLELLNFLDLPDDGRRAFPVVNANKHRRSYWLAERLKKPTPAMRRIWRMGTRLLGKHDSIAHDLLARIGELNTRVAPRRPLLPDTRVTLENTFADDIALLEQLSGRDLSHWIRRRPRESVAQQASPDL